MNDYSSSGVDREAAEVWLDEMGSEIKKSFRPEILSAIGGYGAEFVAPSKMKKPVWVATTDGVGTKLMLAELAGEESFFGIGIDLVAMSVNDLLACRAEPLIFLDYLATGKIQKHRQQIFLRGVLEGCKQAGCSLVGGETAEMPGFYSSERMDVAGFSVGVKEGAQQVDLILEGDEIWGLASSGFHSNGYSLIRKIVTDQKLSWDQEIAGTKLIDFLLAPTRIYSSEVLPWFENPQFKALAHLTGGGVVENLPRVFPENLSARVSKDAFPKLVWMQKFADWSGMNERETFSTWNMGIGLCAIVNPKLGGNLASKNWIKLGVMTAKTGEPVSLV